MNSKNLQFKIFRNKNIIYGISNSSHGSISQKGDTRQSLKKAVLFLKEIGYKDVVSQNIIWAEQVFGARVHLCSGNDSGHIIKGVDSLISACPGQILAITTADCVPLLFYEPKCQVVAAIHGARECLIKGIVRKTINQMKKNFNIEPRNILVVIGPHIRSCHYWLKNKTYQRIRNTSFAAYFIAKEGNVYFNLTQLALDQLLNCGIRKENIEDCKICTFCNYRRYFSQRKKEETPKVYKEISPRFANFIGLKYPRVLKLDHQNYKNILKETIRVLKKDGIVVCSTDTVYGLICDATNEKAVKSLVKIKNRPAGKPIPIFVKDIKMAKRLAFVNKSQEIFLQKYWPGRLTTVLKSKNKLPKLLSTGKSIGLRIPDHKFINDLMSKINRPLTGTSANVSGEPSCWNAKAVLKQFKNRKYQPDLVIDVGSLPKRKPSKVIDLTTWPPKVLRK